MSFIPIAITDDESLFRNGLKMLLEDDEDISVLFDAENGQDLLDQLKTASPLPQAILLDLQMPVLNGVETTKRLQKEYPDIRIIILTTHYNKGFIINMIELGAASYLPKNTEPDEMAKTIREVVSKGFYYNDFVLSVIRENMLHKIKHRQLEQVKLTKRELEILQLICDQNTTAEIAQELYISPRTVDGHRNNLLDKTGAKNTAGLVVFALENKLVDIDKSWF